MCEIAPHVITYYKACYCTWAWASEAYWTLTTENLLISWCTTEKYIQQMSLVLRKLDTKLNCEWCHIPQHCIIANAWLLNFFIPLFVKKPSTETTVCPALFCLLIQPQILMWVGIHKKAFLLLQQTSTVPHSPALGSEKGECVSVFVHAAYTRKPNKFSKDIKNKILALWPLAILSILKLTANVQYVNNNTIDESLDITGLNQNFSHTKQ